LFISARSTANSEVSGWAIALGTVLPWVTYLLFFIRRYNSWVLKEQTHGSEAMDSMSRKKKRKQKDQEHCFVIMLIISIFIGIYFSYNAESAYLEVHQEFGKTTLDFYSFNRLLL